LIEWRIYSGEDIVSHFPENEWHNILSDISTDKELRIFLQWDFVHGYVAYNRANTPVAFALLIEVRWRDNQVQIHGGCWSGSAWDSYEALITMIENLFAEGKAVRSQCSLDNKRTARFLQSLGFINHYTSDKYRYYWLPYKRFLNTQIYKRIRKKTCYPS
jgi:hypothetical protein